MLEHRKEGETDAFVLGLIVLTCAWIDCGRDTLGHSGCLCMLLISPILDEVGAGQAPHKLAGR